MLKCLTFGFKNAPAFFQCNMTKLLCPLIDRGICFVYIDNIVIMSNTFEEHCSHMQEVLETLAKGNWKATPDKCHLFLKQIKVLGRVVNANGITTDPDTVKDILQFPQPRTKTGVRSFLGLTGALRDFLKDYTEVAEPLTYLTGDVPFEWTQKQTDSFEKLKKMVTDAPCLVHVDLERKMKIQCDACLVGAGAVLLQLMDDNKWHPATFTSWKFTPAQQRYHTTDRELLSVLYSLCKWRPFVVMKCLIFQNNHQALKGYIESPDLFGRKACWAAELLSYGVDIEHIKGVDNPISDSVSCAYCDDDFEDTHIVASIVKGLAEDFHKDEQEVVKNHLASVPYLMIKNGEKSSLKTQISLF